MAEEFKSRIILAAKNTGVAAFRQVSKASIGVAKSLGRTAVAGAKAGAVIAAAFGANAARLTTNFSASISELSAITGASGEDLAFLSEKAKEFGRTTTLSASQAAQAFKLVASAKPDLLESRDALSEVTFQAILLAEAAGIELTEAAATVGESLNQFGAEASQAARFVNVLAAGAKFGSSEIADTSEALINAGVAAKSAGLSFEETNALIQTMATAGIKGSDAGTKLRSALIKLQVQANDKFNPAIVGMNQALDNLAEANLTITERVKLFGERSLVVGDILIENRDKFDELEVKISGTATALEQAAVRNDNLAGDLKQLNSVFEGFSITLGEKVEPLMRAIVQIASSIIGEFDVMAQETESANVNFEILDQTLRNVAAGFSIVETVVQVLGKTIGAVAAFIVTALKGEFGQLDDIVAFAFDDITTEVAAGLERMDKIISSRSPDKTKEALAPPAVLDAAREAGEIIAQNLFEGLATSLSIADQATADAQLKRLTDRVEAIRVSTLTEIELEREKQEEIRGVLFQAKLAGIEDEVVLAALREKVIADSESRITKLQTVAITDRASFEAASAKSKTKFVLGELQSLTAGVATSNKAMFRINQAAAIGNAIINIAEGISKAWALGPIIGPPMAAIVAAAGAAQIATIASARPGGGTTPSVAGSTPTLGGRPVGGPVAGFLGGPTGAPSGLAGQTVTINIDGIPEAGVMPAETVRELIRSINEELGDGANLAVAGRT